MTEPLRVVPLGTSSGAPTRERNVAAVGMLFAGHGLLFDCGEGTQRRMLDSPVRFRHLEAVLISHLHLDHVLGLPGLLNTLNLFGRTEPFVVRGPAGLAEFLSSVLRQTHARIRYELDLVEIESGLALARDAYVVHALPLKHVVPSIGYVVHFAGRRGGVKVAYCSDTMPCENAIELARGTDLLIHEATFSEAYRSHAKKYGHSTAADAAGIAAAAGAKRLLLTHISAREGDASTVLAEARKTFANTEAASDLMTLELHETGIDP